jgi:Neuraminidase (sialidase)
MLAYRSKDKGKTWTGPTIAFDIDYNQHGFIPFIPSGSRRMYAFGTQPMWGLYNAVENRENAPIGYRYSDDDGLHWSEVKFIRPKKRFGF